MSFIIDASQRSGPWAAARAKEGKLVATRINAASKPYGRGSGINGEGCELQNSMLSRYAYSRRTNYGQGSLVLPYFFVIESRGCTRSISLLLERHDAWSRKAEFDVLGYSTEHTTQCDVTGT